MKKAMNWKPPKTFQERAPCAAWELTMSRRERDCGAEDHSYQRQPEREFVADHLRGGAERAEERVLAVGAPARESDAVDADAGDAEDDQQTDVEVRDLEEVDAVHHGEGAEGNDGDGDERAAEGDDGREDEQRALDGERHHVFLEEELEAVDQGLC